MYFIARSVWSDDHVLSHGSVASRTNVRLHILENTALITIIHVWVVVDHTLSAATAKMND